MLVLSRREDQKILFPKLGITVEIVGIRGRQVRLGIDAPPEIRVLRAELETAAAAVDNQSRPHSEGVEASDTSSAESEQAAPNRHALNNKLNAAGLSLQLAQRLMRQGMVEEALTALTKSLQQFRDLENVANAGKLPDSVNRDESPKGDGNRGRALIVEDDANERQLLASILRMSGFEVDTVNNGIEAIEYLRSRPHPDFMLMDMQMPQLSGPETISAIRNELDIVDVPIYGVSGLQRREVEIPRGKRGVTAWFAKPVDTDQMLRKLAADLRSRVSTLSPTNN